MNVGLILLITGLAVTGAGKLATSSYSSFKEALDNSTKYLASGGANGKQSPKSFEGEKPKAGPEGVIGKVGKAIWNHTPPPVRVALGVSGLSAGAAVLAAGAAGGIIEGAVVRPALRQVTRPIRFLGSKIYTSPVGQLTSKVGKGISNAGSAIKKGAETVGNMAVEAKDAVGGIIGGVRDNTVLGGVASAGFGLAGAALGGLGLSKLIADKTNARHNGKLEVNGATGGGYAVSNDKNKALEELEQKKYLSKDVKRMIVQLAYIMKNYHMETSKMIKEQVDSIKQEVNRKLQDQIRVDSTEQVALRDKLLEDIREKLPKGLKLSKNYYQKLANEIVRRSNEYQRNYSSLGQAKRETEKESASITEKILRKSISENATIKEKINGTVATLKPQTKEDEDKYFDTVSDAIIEDLVNGNTSSETDYILGDNKNEIKEKIERAKNDYMQEKLNEIEGSRIGEYLKAHKGAKLSEARKAIREQEQEEIYNQAINDVVKEFEKSGEQFISTENVSTDNYSDNPIRNYGDNISNDRTVKNTGRDGYTLINTGGNAGNKAKNANKGRKSNKNKHFLDGNGNVVDDTGNNVA